MAVAFENGSGSTYASRSSNTLTAPTGIVDGDWLLLHYLTTAQPGTPPTPVVPAGFTLLTGFPTALLDGTGFAMRIWRYAKKASGESGNYTVTHSSCSCQGWIGRFSGADPVSPFVPDASANSGTASGSGQANATAVGLTTTRDGAMIVYFSTDWGDAANNLTPPSGMTEQFDTTISYVATEARPTAGPTGDRSHLTNTTINGNPWSASLIAIEPPAVVAGQTLRPDADIATTGWATAPLFSKLNDQSDATVVTGALA